MPDPTDLEPFEQRLQAGLEAYVAPITEVRPSEEIAEAAMVRRPSRDRLSSPGWRAAVPRLVGVAVAAALAIAALWAIVPRREAGAGAPSSSATATPGAVIYPLRDEPGWIVYVDGDIRLVRTDGSEDHVVRSDVGVVRHNPEWTPDGAGLLFEASSAEGGSRRIWRYDLAAQASTPAVPCDGECVEVTEAAVSPDGTRIAYRYAEGPLTQVHPGGDIVDIPATCGIRLADTRDSTTETLTAQTCGLIEDRYPRWSPDGTQLAVLRTEQGQRGGTVIATDLVSIDVATGAERIVAHLSDLGADPIDWSPDGRSIAMTRNGGSLARIRVDDGTLEELVPVAADGSRALHPRYTADGRWLLYVRERRDGPIVVSRTLWAAPAEGGASVEVLPADSADQAQQYGWASLQPVP